VVAASRPNIVLVVLDCVRALSFPGTGGSDQHLPRIAELRRESVVYARAATVAPWTLPAHATLFTGRYPWEHGVMGDGQLRFDASVPTVPALLRPQGYTSLALSANGTLVPFLAQEGAFDAYRSAEWWEKTFRWLRPEELDLSPRTRSRGGRSTMSLLVSAVARRHSPRLPTDLIQTPHPTATLFQRLSSGLPEVRPIVPGADSISWVAIDGLNRIARGIGFPDDPRPLPAAPWIEGTLEAWLARRPADQPFHCFINLLDAHEKYLSDGEVVPGLAAWLRFIRISQNQRRWLQGEWSPSDEEFRLLRELYERTIRILDRRLGAIMDVLRRTGRWENTLFVVTSDHGQAFGEHGELFHERSPYQPLLHVPLWVRWPRGDGGGRTVRDAVSLVDVAPTMLAAAGADLPPGLPGVALDPYTTPPRSTPVLGMADGFPCILHYRHTLSAAVVERLQHSYAVAYVGGVKAVVGLRGGETQCFDLDSDPNEQHNLAGAVSPDIEAAFQAARTVAHRIEAARGGTVDPALEERLDSWGY